MVDQTPKLQLLQVNSSPNAPMKKSINLNQRIASENFNLLTIKPTVSEWKTPMYQANGGFTELKSSRVVP